MAENLRLHVLAFPPSFLDVIRSVHSFSRSSRVALFTSCRRQGSGDCWQEHLKIQELTVKPNFSSCFGDSPKGEKGKKHLIFLLTPIILLISR